MAFRPSDTMGTGQNVDNFPIFFCILVLYRIIEYGKRGAPLECFSCRGTCRIDYFSIVTVDKQFCLVRLLTNAKNASFLLSPGRLVVDSMNSKHIMCCKIFFLFFLLSSSPTKCRELSEFPDWAAQNSGYVVFSFYVC